MHSIQLLWLFVAVVSGSPQGYGGQYGDLVYEPEGSASDSYPEQYPTPSSQDAQYNQPQKETQPAADYPAYSPSPSYGPLKRPYSSRKVSKRPLKIGQVVPTRQYSPNPYQDEKPAYPSSKPHTVDQSYPKEESQYSTPTPFYSTPAPSYSSPAPSYSTPAPSYSTPAPSYSSPAPSYSTPAPSYSSPAPSYSTPASLPKSRPHNSRKSSRYSSPKPQKRVYATDSSSYDAVTLQKAAYNHQESEYSRKPSRRPEEQSYYDSAESVYSPRKEVYPKPQQKSSYYDDKYNYNRYDEKDPYFNAPATYNYGYEVAEEKTNFNHQENREGHTTKGEYRVALPDGRVQIVRYIADENGYNAEVSYEGEAQYPEYNDNYLKDSY